MKIFKVLKRIAGVIIAVSAIVAVIAFIADLFTNKWDKHKPYGIYEKYIKRPLDAFLSMGALIVFSPILLITALAVRLKLGSPILFTQERPGRNGRVFKLYKFRTMTDERDENGELLPDEQRLPKFGQLLRSTSLDEMPELINIIRGDMALVGPRPLLVKYLERYTPEQRRRHEVRPGLTGLAMATVRNSAGWDRKFELDVKYVDEISFLMDLKILYWTVGMVLRREGINEPGNATNSEFRGKLGARK